MHPRRGERLVRELGEGVAAPQGQRRRHLSHCSDLVAGLLRSPTGCDQPLELDRVDGQVARHQPVAGRMALQVRRRPQRPPQPGQVRTQRGNGGVRRMVSPHDVDQPVHRNDVAAGDQQRRQQDSGLGTTDVDRAVLVLDLQWSQDPQLHRRLSEHRPVGHPVRPGGAPRAGRS